MPAALLAFFVFVVVAVGAFAVGSLFDQRSAAPGSLKNV